MFFHLCYEINCFTKTYQTVPLKVPTAVEVSPKTTTSVTVTMTAAEHNTDVSFYEAAYQRQICSVPAGASALSCSLVNLSAGTRYRISAMACMAGFECSHRRFAEGFTFPDGEHTVFQYFRFRFPDISNFI